MLASDPAGVQSTLDENRKAVSAFVAAARAVPRSAWAAPRAPAKWSPAQVTEHVAGRFTRRGKSPAPFQPSAVPGSVADVTARLNTAAGAFEADVAAAAASGRVTIDHPFFGRLPLADYSRLQAIHTRHHAQQLGPAVS
jgi:hypothetical protein